MVHNGEIFEAFDNSDRQTNFAIINTLFVSSLLSPLTTRLSPLDTWGNVKIPLIETFESTSNADSEGWFTTKDSHLTYSSLVGVPISNITENFVDYMMDVETQYLHLDCPVVYGELIEEETLPSSINVFKGSGAQMWSYDNTIRRYYASWNHNGTVYDLRPREFSYQWSGPTQRSDCRMTTTYVEARIVCPTSSSCSVAKIRRSRSPHPPVAFTLIDIYFQGWEIYSGRFVDSIRGRQGYPTAVQNYLLNPTNPLDGAYINGGYAPGRLADRPSNEVYAIRLSQMMNTWWDHMNGMHAIPDGMTPETAFMEGSNISTPTAFSASSSTKNGTRSISTSVIECNKAWMAISTIASTVMVIASLVRPVVRYFFTQGPDIMLNISSLAMRDNAYIAAPWNGTSMPASKRSRLLQAFKVRFGDVYPDEDVGRLAIATFNPFNTQSAIHIRKGRWYE